MRTVLESIFGQVDLRGIFGNEKVMDYYEKNKASVRNFTRWDLFNLQYRLPRRWLQIPYDMANRLNRQMLEQKNDRLVSHISSEDYPIRDLNPRALDYFAVCTK
jgi:hypothetical protein